MIRTFKFAGVLTVMFLTAACVGRRFYSTPDDNIYILADYQDAVEYWTADDAIHHHLIGVAHLTAVYRSWEVRQAYLNTVRNSEPETERFRRLEERELNRFYAGHEFTLGLYCHDDEWSRLTGPDPVWHLSLETDCSRPVFPELIEMDSLSEAEAWLYYGELHHWGKVFRVVFPLTDADGNPVIDKSTRRITLSCGSILGSMQLIWRLRTCPEGETGEAF
ncbi:hypothetical protein JXA40_11335 [bacterium]|nr:hypothetical protein [candidate division CSSED10-310 bacterium]